MSPAALPVEAPTPDIHFTELLTARVDVELEPTPGLGELRDVEVCVHSMLPRDRPHFRSLAHGRGTRTGVRVDCSLASLSYCRVSRPERGHKIRRQRQTGSRHNEAFSWRLSPRRAILYHPRSTQRRSAHRFRSLPCSRHAALPWLSSSFSRPAAPRPTRPPRLTPTYRSAVPRSPSPSIPVSRSTRTAARPTRR